MFLKLVYVTLSVVLLGFSKVQGNENGEYRVGVGIADVTGPVADLGMMGYANPSQTSKGLHFRLYARSFIFGSIEEGSPLVVFLSADIGMVDQGLKFEVVSRLQKLYDPTIFTPQNVLLSGTHTHSGPAAYLQYLMYSVTSLGFYRPSFDAIVDGMVQSIQRAYENLKPGKLYINKGDVDKANINRSPSSYLANPKEERDKYQSDVDKQMVLLKVVQDEGEKPIGAVNWFAVHPTSMNNTNRLISGDNKGYAAMLFEYEMNPDSRPGKGEFVAAFASSNLGDVSPNIMGAKCIDTGLPCDFEHSSCGGLTQKCIAFGPGKNGDMEESTEIIGRRQYNVSLSLFKDENGEAEQIKGTVHFIHQYVNMTNYTFEVTNPITKMIDIHTTCPAAMGYSFAGGTTDGPGMFDFVQGITTGNIVWDTIRDFLKKPSEALLRCQEPKPVLLPAGEANFPFPWVASVVETQILRVGNLYIIGIPGELTTMAGRRLRNAIEEVVRREVPDEPAPHVVIAGLSNVYTHYITTFEEYQKQRYEAASTLYGPHTLGAYIHKYSFLAEKMLKNEDVEVGPEPPHLIDGQIFNIPVIRRDTAPLLKNFGDCLVEPPSIVNPNDTVVVRFVGGHPRHNSMREGTFLLVEKALDPAADTWETIASDADWSTKFHWSRPNVLSKESVIEISWKVPSDAEGCYRIRHFGYHRPSDYITGDLLGPRSYQGKSAIFKVNGTGDDVECHPEWTSERKQPSKINSVAQFWHALRFLDKRHGK
ncbi:Neutral ceramidase B [Orchesella cincta]|uniref:Neutral ceramidase n=1 Tax=Orchesella cincta TaxID=48709 RepID=A0A1D2N706_ORCCI|nr:Neutral ceramidase B [Orchesella cincta]